MDSKEPEEKVEDRHPIYYMNCRIAYWKKKVKHEVDEWVVSIYDDPIQITKKDSNTMQRLYRKIYKNSVAKDNKVVVVRVFSKKIVGYTNY